MVGTPADYLVRLDGVVQSAATVTWTPAPDNPDSPITGYVVTCTDGTNDYGPVFVPGVNSTTTADNAVTGLPPASVFYCTAITLTAAGNSPPSDPSNQFSTL